MSVTNFTSVRVFMLLHTELNSNVYYEVKDLLHWLKNLVCDFPYFFIQPLYLIMEIALRSQRSSSFVKTEVSNISTFCLLRQVFCLFVRYHFGANRRKVRSDEAKQRAHSWQNCLWQEQTNSQTRIWRENSWKCDSTLCVCVWMSPRLWGCERF